MSFLRYATLVCAVSSLSLLVNLIWLPAWMHGAVALGVALAALNAGAAYYLAMWSAARSSQVFLGMVLGGMLGRMILMLTAVALAVVMLAVPPVPLVVALMGHFIVFFAVEMRALQTRLGAGARAS